MANSGVKKTVFAVLTVIVVIVGLLLNKVLNPPSLTPEQFRERGVFLYDPPRKLKNFELRDHTGQTFNKDNLKGQWSLVFFGFTHCPDVCPTTMAMLNNAMGEIKDDDIRQSTEVVLVSVDPARDTVEQLGNYVPFFNPDFIGLTGEFITIAKLAANLNAAFQKVPGGGEQYNVDHSAYIFVLNPRGDFQGFMKPPFDPQSFAINYLAIRKKFENTAY
ncbi:SCO1 protein [BD1-7 clade bacterium]|uniref:SCO1 protein n=1 Tax=BD1-7 clade bacterium TaxID=2029982 RepID=A0A5S9MW92_9GAMM|nr:SCO1 protein [BD1-7 clade bacterium]CAA0083577.1 SCO1 protein [BD1-7 clade bacterium]